MKTTQRHIQKTVDYLNKEAEKNESTVRYYPTGDRQLPIIAVDLADNSFPERKEWLKSLGLEDLLDAQNEA